MADYDYSDERKAIAHDQTRYLWEGDSGFTFMDSSTPAIYPTSLDVSRAFEYGFDAGWERAAKALQEEA